MKTVAARGHRDKKESVSDTLRRGTDRRYWSLTEASSDAIIVHRNGTFLYANPEALALYGAASFAQLKERDVFDLISPADREASLERLARLRKGEQLPLKEARLIRLDGQEVQVEFFATLITYGKYKAVQVVLRDITDRKKAEEKLRLSEEKLAKAFASNPAAICMARLRDGIIIEVNDAWEVTFGYSRGEAIGHSKTSLNIWPSAEARERFAEELREKGSFRDREQMLLRRSGEPFVSLSSADILMIGGEEVVLWTWLDISDRKRAEQALQEANTTLERKVQQRTAQLRKLAGELTLAEQRERMRLARIIHDHLQQLLVAAKFRASVLGRGRSDALKEAVKEIDDLLDESIVASRSLTADLSPPILHEAGLSAGVQWLSRRMADKHGLCIELEVEEIGPLPDDLKYMLFESIRELLSNIVEHACMRSASLSLRRVGTSLQVTISGQGTGFDSDRLAADSGLGFGLFGIRERIQLVGGTLEIDSSPDQGSRVVITVPLTEAGCAEPQFVEIQCNGRSGDPLRALSPSGRKIRVMLADDHAVVRQGIATMLGDEPDIEIVGAAADGQEAVSLAHKLLPDIILMDISMPKLNGVEATRIIHSEYREICVIALSMFEEVERAQAMREAGAVHYVTKSGAAEALIAAIRKYGSRRREMVN